MYAREIRSEPAVDAHAELERCLEIRRRVFIEEQGVEESLELDGLEGECIHFLVFPDASERFADAIGTARLWTDPTGVAKAQRVAVLASERKSGAGRALMRAIEEAARDRGHDSLLLGAQCDAIPFYERLGYLAFGEVFDDAGIPHRMMQLRLRG